MVNTESRPASPVHDVRAARHAYPEDVAARLQADAAVILAKYPEARSALLPLLHLVQSEDGYVSPAGVGFCAEVLGLERAAVSAVATFYSQYKRHPNGAYTVGVCTNTLCAVMGGDAIFDRLSEHLGVGHDETTDDGAITLERLECNAACDYAPVMMINWEFFDNQSPASAVETVDSFLAGEPVRPTRGAESVATFEEGLPGARRIRRRPRRRGQQRRAGHYGRPGGLARKNDWRAPGAQASPHLSRRPEPNR